MFYTLYNSIDGFCISVGPYLRRYTCKGLFGYVNNTVMAKIDAKNEQKNRKILGKFSKFMLQNANYKN